jgi:hypothetical protein
MTHQLDRPGIANEMNRGIMGITIRRGLRTNRHHRDNLSQQQQDRLAHLLASQVRGCPIHDSHTRLYIVSAAAME